MLLWVGGRRVRLLLLTSRWRASRGGGRARRTTARGSGGTTALTRHFGCVRCNGVDLEDRFNVDAGRVDIQRVNMETEEDRSLLSLWLCVR